MSFSLDIDPRIEAERRPNEFCQVILRKDVQKTRCWRVAAVIVYLEEVIELNPSFEVEVFQELVLWKCIRSSIGMIEDMASCVFKKWKLV